MANGKWQMANDNRRVAIVCDWLVDVGGAERVVLELHNLFPKAPIYTSQYAPKSIGWFAKADVRTGWLQKLPKALRKFLPVLRAIWFSRLDLSDYDMVISASGAEAKFVNPNGKWQMANGNSNVNRPIHISYIHAPTHYYWSRYGQYLREPGFGAFDWLARLGLKLLVGPMRRWDKKAAQRPDYLIANSYHTAREIKKYYGREASVIHPPVDVEKYKKYSIELNNRHGYVITGRQTPYKRVDLAIEACSQLKLPLVVIGNGPEHASLMKQAAANVSFVTNAQDDEVAKYVGSSRAFIFPNIDDFGIAPVEALAAGTPVVAFKGGGALDYVIDGQNGWFFSPQTVGELAKTLKKIESAKYTPQDIIRSARVFSNDNFHRNMTDFIKKL